MFTAFYGMRACLEHLIAKGTNVNAQNKVRRLAARRVLARGEWGRLRAAAPLPPLPRWRRHASFAAAPRCRLATCSRPSAARLACKPAGERARLWRWGRGGARGRTGLGHPPQTPATPTRPPAAYPRACGPRLGSTRARRCTSRLPTATLPAPSRCSRRGSTRVSRTMCAIAPAAEGGGVGRGGCQGGGGREALRRRRAASPRRPTPTLRGCRLYRNPPCRRGATRRWTRPIRSCTRRSSGCWRTPPPSQRRSAAPRRTPHPAAPPLRRLRPMRAAASLAVASQHSRALSPYHSSPSTPYLSMGTQYTHTYIYMPAHLPLSGPLLPQPHAQTTLLIHRKYRQRKYGHSEYSHSEYTLTRV